MHFNMNQNYIIILSTMCIWSWYWNLGTRENLLLNHLEVVVHHQWSLRQMTFHSDCCKFSGHTSDQICPDVQLQRNIQIKGHAGCCKLFYYTMAHLYTNDKKIHQQLTTFSLQFISTMEDQHDETQPHL